MQLSTHQLFSKCYPLIPGNTDTFQGTQEIQVNSILILHKTTFYCGNYWLRVKILRTADPVYFSSSKGHFPRKSSEYRIQVIDSNTTNAYKSHLRASSGDGDIYISCKASSETFPKPPSAVEIPQKMVSIE